MSDIATLVAKLTMNSSEFRKGIDDARGDLSNLSKSVDMVKGAVAGFLTFQAIKGAFDWVKDGVAQLDDLGAEAERIGVSAQGLKELQYAAELSDTSAEDLNAALLKMNKILGDATEEGKKTAAAISERLGKSMIEIERQGPEETFLQVADAISQIENPMQRAAAVTDIFGKSGQGLITTLNRGRDGINELRAEARAFYGTDLNQLVDRAGQADDAMKRFDAAVEGLKFTFAADLAGPLADSFTDLAGVLRDVVAPALKFVSATWREVLDDMDEIGAVVGGIIGGASREDIGRDLKIMRDRREESRAAAGGGRGGIGVGAGPDATVTGRPITIKTPALELGSKEGFGVIARALSARTAKDPGAEQVKAQKETTTAVKGVEAAVKGLGKIPAPGAAF